MCIEFQHLNCQVLVIKGLDYFVTHAKMTRNLQVGLDTIHPATSILDLCVGLLLHPELTMLTHVSKVASICFFKLRRLRQVRHLVGRKVTTRLTAGLCVRAVTRIRTIVQKPIVR